MIWHLVYSSLYVVPEKVISIYIMLQLAPLDSGNVG